MPNPGSPQQMKQMQQDMPQMPKGTMLSMLFVLLIMMVVMQFRETIGGVLNCVFQYIAFNGSWPVLTLVMGGLIMITLSTVVRGFLTNPIEQAKSQQLQSDFQKEMREAKAENNLFKMKKLQEAQPGIMAASMKQSTDMMKYMPVTMVVVIPIYAWVWFFLNNTVPSDMLTIAMPWGMADLMSNVWFMPLWIVIYTLISLPIGQLENRVVRYFMLKKRLKELDETA